MKQLGRRDWAVIFVTILLIIGGGVFLAAYQKLHSQPRKLPAAPPLGTAQVIEPGIVMYDVPIPSQSGVSHLWLYLPQNPTQKPYPCIFIAPAGTPLFTGNSLGDGDRAEHLPYVRQGMAVAAYELDGALPNDHATDQEYKLAIRQFHDCNLGLDNAKAAIDYVLTHVKDVDPKRLYSVGHSSAGTLSLQLAQNDPRIAACIAYAPCCDELARLGSETLHLVDAVSWGMSALLSDLSPSAHPEKLRVPTFLFHADDDTNVRTKEVLEFAQKVQVTNPNLHFERVASGEHYQSMIDQGIPDAIQWLQHLPIGIAAPPGYNMPMPEQSPATPSAAASTPSAEQLPSTPIVEPTPDNPGGPMPIPDGPSAPPAPTVPSPNSAPPSPPTTPGTDPGAANNPNIVNPTSPRPPNDSNGTVPSPSPGTVPPP